MPQDNELPQPASAGDSRQEDGIDDKVVLTTVASFRAGIGGQEIDLRQVEYVHGGMHLLRLRIREGRRFTVFDLDPVIAREWGMAMLKWAQGQEQQAAGNAASVLGTTDNNIREE